MNGVICAIILMLIYWGFGNSKKGCGGCLVDIIVFAVLLEIFC